MIYDLCDAQLLFCPSLTALKEAARIFQHYHSLSSPIGDEIFILGIVSIPLQQVAAKSQHSPGTK